VRIENSSIDKCVHGVYLASSQEMRTESARYCCWCSPQHVTNLVAGFLESESNKKFMPGMRPEEHVYANLHNNECPNCGSRFRYRLPDGRDECAECGAKRETSRSLRLKARADAGHSWSKWVSDGMA
jgi:hypothetical protein